MHCEFPVNGGVDVVLEESTQETDEQTGCARAHTHTHTHKALYTGKICCRETAVEALSS